MDLVLGSGELGTLGTAQPRGVMSGESIFYAPAFATSLVFTNSRIYMGRMGAISFPSPLLAPRRPLQKC